MTYVLYDSEVRANLLPFTHTRAIADIRCGILTMKERWAHVLGAATSVLTESYLQDMYRFEPGNDTIYINASVFASRQMADAIAMLTTGQALVSNGTTIAARLQEAPGKLEKTQAAIAECAPVLYEGEVYALHHNWDIFALCDRAIRDDFAVLTSGRSSTEVPEGVVAIGGNNVFIEPGAKVYAGCIINASTGPVYIGAHAEVLEGTMMRGPIAICEHAVVKMGAKVYGATTIGPGCKVGGEINNVVFFANSNKSHDGYLGNAVIGEWCNLGADTNCSNLKNDYGVVKVWNEATDSEISTGLTFCGLMMGDHSKCGINTMFNTGTVIGVSCNIYGGGFPAKFIPSFSWGGSEGWTDYRLDKAIDTANRMMTRRNKQMSPAEIHAWKHLYAQKRK